MRSRRGQSGCGEAVCRSGVFSLSFGCVAPVSTSGGRDGILRRLGAGVVQNSTPELFAHRTVSSAAHEGDESSTSAGYGQGAWYKCRGRSKGVSVLQQPAQPTSHSTPDSGASQHSKRFGPREEVRGEGCWYANFFVSISLVTGEFYLFSFVLACTVIKDLQGLYFQMI